MNAVGQLPITVQMRQMLYDTPKHSIAGPSNHLYKRKEKKSNVNFSFIYLQWLPVLQADLLSQ